MKIICGIYQITNIINGHKYIGSSININKRWKQHIYYLLKNRHHSPYMQNAFNLYKQENFKFEVLQETPEHNLIILEQYYIDLLKPEYNLGVVGRGFVMRNHPNYKQIIEKQSNSKKGDKNPGWKGGISRLLCPVCKTNKMKPKSKQCVKCINGNSGFYGKKHSDESKNKIRIKNLGKKPSNSKNVVINGVQYKSIADAAKGLGIKSGCLYYRLKHNYYTVTGPNSNLG